MQHARPRVSGSRAERSPVALPAVLVTLAAGAFAGLTAVQGATDPAPVPPRPVAATAAGAAAERPLDLLPRASRSRALAPSQPTAAPAPAKRTAKAKPTAKPQPKPKPKTKPKAVRRAPAGRRTAARHVHPPVHRHAEAPQTAGRCPVPSASFTDTWGEPRSGGRTHQGTDLLAAHGAPVYAVASGVVDTTYSSNGGISLYLRARNGERYFYAHNAANLVDDGARVVAGELIARVGSSGNAQGSAPHVHFEREVGGRAVNPYRFLRGLCG